MKFSSLFFSFFLFSISSPGYGAVYEFIPNTNLLKSKPWLSSTCSKDRIVFEPDDPSAVFIDSNWEFSEIVCLGRSSYFSDSENIKLIFQILPSQQAFEIIIGDEGTAFGKEKSKAKKENCEGK